MSKDIKPTPEDTLREEEGLNEVWLTDVEAPENFNWQWREVIRSLLYGEDAYVAYAQAYEIDISAESGKRQAMANSSRLIRNDKFKRLWRQVLDETGFNAETMDSVTLSMIKDESTPHQTRRALIRDFNELNGRIVNRTDLTTLGEKIERPVVMAEIKPRVDDADQAPTE